MEIFSKFKQFFRRKAVLRAEIILDRVDHTFMPGDAIWGSVKIVALQDVEITEAYVSIEGTNFTELQRAGMGSAQGVVVTSEEHILLKTEETLIGNQGLPAKLITKGQSQRLVFKLTVPLRLNRACSHSIDNDGLRDEHRLLPPSLSIGGPDTVEIRYSINFVSKGRPMHSLHSSFTTQAVARTSITVVPTRSTRPMSVFRGPVSKTKKLRSLLGASDIREVQILAYQPPAIVVDAQKAGPLSTEAIAVGLVLKVTSKSEANLLQLLEVERSFTSLTFLSTVPWDGIPMVYQGLGSSMKRGLRREHFKLSKLKLPPTTWERVVDAGSGDTDDQAQCVYLCRLSIPIYPTVDMVMIPTFYSCLTARLYYVKNSVSFCSQSARRSSISLEIPIDVVHIDSQAKCGEHSLR